jgi:hypothetical protein
LQGFLRVRGFDGNGAALAKIFCTGYHDRHNQRIKLEKMRIRIFETDLSAIRPLLTEARRIKSDEGVIRHGERIDQGREGHRRPDA